MENFLSLMLEVKAMAPDDYVGFTFFVGCMAMMAASAFFFLSMNSFDSKWRTSDFSVRSDYFHCSSALLVHA